MRIAFVDASPADYNVTSPYNIPLGGSHSAVCYLAAALAKQGHEVALFNHTSQPGHYLGVDCLKFEALLQPEMRSRSLDAVVVFRQADLGPKIKSHLPETTHLIFWSQDVESTATVLLNPEVRELYRGFAFVSEWQRQRFQKHLGILPSRTQVLRNAISPIFEGLFPVGESILAYKQKPPVLAYISTPFRGLKLLLDVFPQIRAAVPGTKLKVFSSLKVYQTSEEEESAHFSALYERCRTTEGVEYLGAVPQLDLAQALKSATLLAYPNTFTETSCISVMEAMASGCQVVTSQLAALPETAHGFAKLIPVEGDWQVYQEHFVEQTIALLHQTLNGETTTLETQLAKQVEYFNRSCNWSIRAKEWADWINTLNLNYERDPGMIIPALSQRAAAYESVLMGEFDRAIASYEQAIQDCPNEKFNYWRLGLALLLSGREEEAQVTWMMGVMQADEADDPDSNLIELVDFLQLEADLYESLLHYKFAWLIREHIQAIATSE